MITSSTARFYILLFLHQHALSISISLHCPLFRIPLVPFSANCPFLWLSQGPARLPDLWRNEKQGGLNPVVIKEFQTKEGDGRCWAAAKSLPYLWTFSTYPLFFHQVEANPVFMEGSPQFSVCKSIFSDEQGLRLPSKTSSCFNTPYDFTYGFRAQGSQLE